MILIDSVYVNEGGGLVLLKYLVSILESRGVDAYYLFDKRTESIFSFIDEKKRIFINNSNISRYFFYRKMYSRFDKVFCFGNVPPVLNLNIPVYVYFHNPTLIRTHSDMSFTTKTMCYVKQNFINFFKRNVDIWFVQNSFMQKELSKKYFYGVDNNVKILPFYPKIDFPNNISSIKNTFLYVSTTYPHKNHIRLILAFCEAYDILKKGKLILTVPLKDTEICDLIEKKKIDGYPIHNLGFIERSQLVKVYKESEYLIFPSLTETFGLGLAEAIDAGCKVLAADLPYSYQICNPSRIFDPLSIPSIKDCIIYAMINELPSSVKHIENDVDKLIEYFK